MEPSCGAATTKRRYLDPRDSSVGSTPAPTRRAERPASGTVSRDGKWTSRPHSRPHAPLVQRRRTMKNGIGVLLSIGGISDQVADSTMENHGEQVFISNLSPGRELDRRRGRDSLHFQRLSERIWLLRIFGRQLFIRPRVRERPRRVWGRSAQSGRAIPDCAGVRTQRPACANNPGSKPTRQLLASQATWAAANAAMDTYGGFGLAEEYGIERKFREARLPMIAPVNNNLILAFIGQNTLKMPRSY